MYITPFIFEYLFEIFKDIETVRHSYSGIGEWGNINKNSEMSDEIRYE